MKFLLLLFLLVFASCIVEGQKLTKDTNDYIIDYSDNLGLFLYSKIKISNFSFVDETNNYRLIYSPNSQTNIGFGFNYKRVNIGIAFDLFNNDNYKYGKTKRIDWQANLYGNKAIIDILFHSYQSHYIRNPQDVFPTYVNGDPNYIRPDILNNGFGFSYIYIFNYKKFSYRAAFLGNARQKKSNGSWFAGGGFFSENISGDSSLFPQKSYFSIYPQITSISTFAIGLKGGYATCIVVKKYFYLSTSLGTSVYFGKRRILNDISTMHDKNEIYGSFQPRFAVGISKEKWFAGFSVVNDFFMFSSISKTNGLSLNYQYGNARLFVGKRFNLSKTIKIFN